MRKTADAGAIRARKALSGKEDLMTQLKSSPSLDRLRVVDAMHPGMIACPPDTTLRTVARMMASYRVHAIFVHAHGDDALPDGESWGVVTDVDLVTAALDGDLDELVAEQIAATPAVTIATADPLGAAIQLMTEHEVAHLFVVERRSKRPIGVLSTLDVARVLAGLGQ
jgi:CBS domain-containing protein